MGMYQQVLDPSLPSFFPGFLFEETAGVKAVRSLPIPAGLGDYTPAVEILLIAGFVSFLFSHDSI